MKKTTSINLGGFVFNIDEDAYQALSNYLTELGKRFSVEEKDEILKDIECRMAELLNSKLNNRNVVEIADIEDVIGVIGRPEDFGEATEGKSEFTEPQQQNKKYRKLYRDPEHKVIGGVASGIAAYFNIDTAVMRILFILFIFISLGWALLIYIILLIAMPEAQTTAQLLEMHGIEPSLENINSYCQNSEIITRKSTGKNILKILLICFGILIGLFCALGVLGICIAIFVACLTYTPGGFGDAIDLALLSSVGVFCLCPVIGIIVLCVRTFRNGGRKHKGVGWILLAIWIISLFAMIGFGIKEDNKNIGDRIEQNCNKYSKLTTNFYLDKTDDDNGDFDEDWDYEENSTDSDHDILTYTYNTGGRTLRQDELNDAIDKISDMYKDDNVSISINANEHEGVQIKITKEKAADNGKTETPATAQSNKQTKVSKGKTTSDTTKTK